MIRKKTAKRMTLILIVLIVTMFVSSQASAAETNLSWGSTGAQVSSLQTTLNALGYWCGAVDGIFGAKTYAAVVRFQKDNGVPATGLVGPLTRAALSSKSYGQVSRGSRVLTMVATGYDDSYECNYPYYGAPSYIGLPLARGIIATDPKVIPMGTRLYVEGYGFGIAADQGNAIKGNRIDLFFDTREEALNWGMRTVKVTIL